MDETKDLLEKIHQELREIKFWTRFSAMPTIRRAIVENLRDDVDKLVYDLSDGNRSTREIASIVSNENRSITHVTVANLWKKWSILGLVVPTKRRGRYMKVFSLTSLGIEVPEI